MVGGQPQTLDPATTRGGASGVVGSIFSGLARLDTDLQVKPGLAEGWDVSPDGLVYTFYLRQDAAFHDGRLVTAEDVIFSWERALDPATASDTAMTYLGDIVGAAEKNSGQSATVSGLEAVDSQTLAVHIDAPKVYFLSKLTYPVSFVVDRNNVSQDDWDRQPNGTGPFTLQEWQDDEILILAANENFYLEPPSISHVVYLIGAGISLNLYEEGQIDLVGIGGNTLERAQDPNDPLYPDLRIGVDMCTGMIGFNSTVPPFDDPLVRQAFSYAIDRQRLISGLYKNNVLQAIGPLPPGMPGYTGQIEGYDYDPERARALLVQAGYPDPADLPPITYTTSGYGSVGSFVTAVITMWQEALDVTIEPVLIDPFNFLDELYSGNTGSIYSHGWCADYPDPENFLDILFHTGSQQNLGGYSNPEIDRLLEQARIEPDVASRMALYTQIEQLIVNDAPAVFTTHSLSAELVKPRLQNYILTPIGVAQWQQVSLQE
jgi:ABC-type transport system substrate-binding protein